MGVEGRNTSWKEAGKLKLIKHNSVCLDGGSVWITCPCPNSSLPGPSCPSALPPPPHPAFFINGSSWRSFSSIQGLLPFGVLISPDAHDTAKAVLETIALGVGGGKNHGPFEGPDEWAQAAPRDTFWKAEPWNKSPWAQRWVRKDLSLEADFCCSLEGVLPAVWRGCSLLLRKHTWFILT